MREVGREIWEGRWRGDCERSWQEDLGGKVEGRL